MKKLGYIASIDLMLSTILLMFAIGYAYRVAEGNFYSLKQDEIYEELRLFGSTAAELLISSPETTCRCSVRTGTNPGDPHYVMNCIDTSKLTNLSSNPDALKSALKVPPSRFGLRIEIFKNRNILVGNYGEPIPNPAEVANIYSEGRAVIINAGDITKGKLFECISGKEMCERHVAKITIWRK
ncbi:MAG: hypothetical protein N3F05_00250 [Candidatus Diapherotrites archaeon]|nr:hypothetical protein [Candidatus Diapherotrites archaeon]